MGDQLEKFIHENRGDFDHTEVPEGLWQKIDGDLAKRKYNWGWVWKAAAVLFLASTLYLIVDKLQSDKPTNQTKYAEFYQAEQFYTTLIHEKKLEIEGLLTEEMKNDFIDELQDLDYMYSELKGTWEDSLEDEKIVDAMIENLQMRVQILNSQLEILKTLREVNNENDDTDNTIEM